MSCALMRLPTSLFLVTTLRKRDSSILQSFRLCCREIPYTCLVSVSGGSYLGSI